MAMNVALAILGYVLFVGLILAHEWGHYIAAKRAGVKVEEFGLGFPPRAYGKKRKDGMILSVNWLPLGGFVKLKGEHDMDRGKGTYGSASLKNKTKIMVAGVTVNFLIAILMFTVLALIGMPKIIDNQFKLESDNKIINQSLAVAVGQGTTAEQAGLRSGDIIKNLRPLNCQSVKETCAFTVINFNDLKLATESLAGQQVIADVKRGNQQLELKPKLLSSAEIAASQNQKAALGVSPAELAQYQATWSAPIVAVGFTAQVSWLTVKGIASALSGLAKTVAGLVTFNSPARVQGQTQATEQTGGILAIVKIIWNSGSLGLPFVLMIIGLLSLSLAIINLLPIPALDGGRLAVTYLFRVIKKPLTPRLEEKIHGTGMAVLLTLFVLITIVDVKRFY